MRAQKRSRVSMRVQTRRGGVPYNAMPCQAVGGAGQLRPAVPHIPVPVGRGSRGERTRESRSSTLTGLLGSQQGYPHGLPRRGGCKNRCNTGRNAHQRRASQLLYEQIQLPPLLQGLFPLPRLCIQAAGLRA